MMAPIWTEAHFKRYIDSWSKEMHGFYYESLDSNVVVRYPGLPEIVGRDAYVELGKRLRAEGLQKIEIIWFLSGPGRFAAMLRASVHSLVDSPQVLNFLDVRVGDRWV